MIPFVAIGALVLVALAAGPALAGLVPTKQDIRKAGNPKITLAFARKWSPIFSAPVPYILTLAHIESSHDPLKKGRMVERRGGTQSQAIGLVQQMADEVPDKVEKIARAYGKNPIVRKTLAKWKGDPNILLDPDFNSMLAAWQIGNANKRFKRFDLVAAAYHQGENGVAKRLAQGLPAVDFENQPKGAAYVSRAMAIEPLYADLA